VDPSALIAVTRTRNVLPTSACPTRYVLPSEAKSTQLLPPALQRNQRYRNSVGLFSHVPFWAVRTSPTRAGPVIVGGSMLTGAAAGAACTAATATNSQRAADSTTPARAAIAVFRSCVMSPPFPCPSGFRVVISVAGNTETPRSRDLQDSYRDLTDPPQARLVHADASVVTDRAVSKRISRPGRAECRRAPSRAGLRGPRTRARR
jgi:hypothetical protein